MLSELHLREVGPAPAMDIEFAERLNIFTGDNGLGKTFLLDCAWWALTGSWPGPMALPNSAANQPSMGFVLDDSASSSTLLERAEIGYDFRTQSWGDPIGPSHRREKLHPAIYVRADGGVSVFEPLLLKTGGHRSPSKPGPDLAAINFRASQIWDGVTDEGNVPIINGLIRDLVQWQHDPEQGESSAFPTFLRVLNGLAHPEEAVEIGRPTRVYLHDARLYPTVRTSHGQYPIHLAPAGLRRILGIAYLTVGFWKQHLALAAITKTPPSRQIEVMIDEAELHLHPKWQRSILPALMSIGEGLTPETKTQLLVTTHSPLVLASIEPVFDPERDRLFLFDVAEGRVELNELPWAKQGDATNWLTSPVFGLSQARSIEAERAIIAANALMRSDLAELPEGLTTKEEIHEELCRVLPAHDRFWPRWIVQDPDDNDDKVGAAAGAAEVR